MPYITCQDGKTYSRYDNSTYVVECIRTEDSIAEAKFRECTLDPTCLKRRQERIEASDNFAICLLLIFIGIGVMLAIRMNTE
jgi:uncharacterized membrane protein affecting hemolysin expression